ncbi:DsbA family protein [Orbaceae bacterium ESL0721]|nr:DsbA family protein [Orbaceae bacterium ESL0721]
MKKSIIAISTLLLSLNCFANTGDTVPTMKPIESGKQYIELPTLLSPEKEVIEFFSFNCPSCFKFDVEYHGTEAISKALPKEVKFRRYHLDNFGPLAPELSEAWAIANVLGIEDKISQQLFEAIHVEHTLKSPDDIKNVFAAVGVNSDQFDKTKGSFLVKSFLVQQSEALNEIQPNSIPTVIVNRKYFINPRGLDQTDNESIINDYARVAAFLTDLNPQKSKTAPANDKKIKVKSKNVQPVTQPKTEKDNSKNGNKSAETSSKDNLKNGSDDNINSSTENSTHANSEEVTVERSVDAAIDAAENPQASAKKVSEDELVGPKLVTDKAE